MTDEQLGKFLKQPLTADREETVTFDQALGGHIAVKGGTMAGLFAAPLIPLRWRSDAGRHGVVCLREQAPLSELLALMEALAPGGILAEVVIFLRTAD